ncbi:MAG: hypothetical protein KJ944_19485 [Alphaproteobacteria bacterium]|nr:hypothetical protein [Alphaproteobacteria bacterium]MBU1560799.1 hypothetical protein [Alphaproteobacteria bacterium]MBU2304773.1 hypothetical protein [Alphaproteobacteria bacterium]MBU2370069.1 hypothetical protein [Alphaproteobacteria bacterium]
MSVLLGVITLFAVLTLAIAVMQAVAMVRVAPASERLASFMPLGWWKFRQLEAKAGPAAAHPLNIYKRAVIAFIVFLLLGLALSSWTINQAPALDSASAQSGLINDPRVIPAEFAFNTDNRRVAIMPGALLLES